MSECAVRRNSQAFSVPESGRSQAACGMATSGRSCGLKRVLDKDLDKLGLVEEATGFVSRSQLMLGFGFLAFVLFASFTALLITETSHWVLMAAALVIGGYMALNIGANDVANNVGPAVGARVLTMTSALLLAALCESAGALLAGREVVATISTRIVDVDGFDRSLDFAFVMISALAAAALWINIATVIGAPVSTTHAIVGGVVGAGIAGAGVSVVDWSTVGAIAVTWFLSPVLGGVVAAFLLAFVKQMIAYRPDPLAAARFWLPVLFAAMAGTFVLYLVLVGMRAPDHIDDIYGIAFLIAVSVGFGVWGCARPWVAKSLSRLRADGHALKHLFKVPLIAAAAILSFAHGANDVANAVGPVAAVVSVLGKEGAPLDTGEWFAPVLLIGAIGISVGVLLFGPRLVRMVGERITRLNPLRAFCVALATGATVLAASGFGLPVSSTHIVVGAVFGVGFYREWWVNRSRGSRYRRSGPSAGVADPTELRRRRLVRRAHVLTIVSAWCVTFPASGLLASLFWFLFAGVR